MRCRCFAIATVLSVALVSLTFTSAQVTTATIYGTVVDTSNARIPGADVMLTQQETGTITGKVSDETGNFQFDFVRPGTYTLTIELPGFKRYEARGMQLGAGQSVRRTYVLEVGQATENVLVEASAPLVNTVSTEQLTTFTNQTVTELPLARRNFSGILAVGTGIAIASGGSSEGIRMNGVGRAGTGVSVDGTDAKGNLESRGAANFNGANYIDTLSSESIAEVNVVKGVLPAEYGSVLGGQVNVMTRSGTNDWHGSLFENYQSASLNARDPFLDSKPPFVYNQFGGSIGGPIIRNRAFIFGAYEGYRESRFRRVEANVPTPYLRNLMLQAVPKYAYTLQVLPEPTEPHGPQANTGRFVGTASDWRHDNHFDFKSDLKFTNISNLAITYSRGRPGRNTDDVTSLVNPDWGSVLNVTADRTSVSYVTGGPTWTSESRVGYNRSDTRNDFGIFGIVDPENPNEQFAYGRRVGIIETNLGFNTPAAEQIELLGPTWNFSQKFAKHVRDHSLKFGTQLTHQCCRRGNVEAIRWNYQGLTDLLNNVPSRVDVAFGQGEYEANMWELGLFLQDDWRVHPRLTLNLGLRYDYFSHMVAEPLGSQGSFLVNPDGMDSQFNVGPIRPWQNPYDSDAINFGPRFGFAYNVDGNGRTVIRGGGGLLFSSFTLAALWSGVHSEFAPRRVVFSRQDAIKYGLKYPMYNDDMRPIVEQLIRDQGVQIVYQVIDPKIQNPYTMQYTLGIQRELTPNLALDTAFVSTLGRKFLTNRTPNEPDRMTGLRPNPNLNTNYYLDASQTSSYFSWQTSLTKRYSRNLSGSLHYTWGKTLATGGADVSAWYQGDNSPRYQDFFDLKNAKGPGQGDLAHYFTAQWVYQLPTLQNFASAVARQILGGWQVGGIVRAESGSPLAITQSSSLRHARPDYVLGQEPILDDWRNTRQYLNPAAFARVPLVAASGAAEHPGTLGWGAVRGPGMWQLDASLSKNFRLTEGVTLQIRSDMFNALNRENYSNPTTSVNSSFFGQIRGTRGQRVIQMNGRLTF